MNSYLEDINEIFTNYNEEYGIFECKLLNLQHQLLVENYIFNEINVNVSLGESKPKSKTKTLQNIKSRADSVADVTKKTYNQFNTFRKRRQWIIEKFKQLLARIIGIFKKFKETCIYKTKENSEWLIKYKSQIFSTSLTNKNIDFGDENLANYSSGQSNMMKLDIKPLNLNDTKLINAAIDENSLRKYIIKTSGLDSKLEKSEDFNNSLKMLFRGDKVDKITGQLLAPNISMMYEYCINYQNKINEMSKELSDIESSVETSINSLNQISESKFKQQPNLHESFNINLLNEQEEEKEVKLVRPNEISSIEQVNSLIKVCNNYLKISSQILGCKMEISEERYNEYMKIFRIIVRGGLSQTKNEKRSGETANNTKQENVVNNKKNKKLSKEEIINKTNNTINKSADKTKKFINDTGEVIRNTGSTAKKALKEVGSELNKETSKTSKVVKDNAKVAKENISKAAEKKINSLENKVEELTKIIKNKTKKSSVNKAIDKVKNKKKKKKLKGD